MRRRVARVVRWVLLLIGLSLLAALPVSFFYGAWIGDVGPDFGWFVAISNGAIGAGYSRVLFDTPGTFYDVVEIPPAERDYYPFAFVPRYDASSLPGLTEVNLPLWLLALICLAWPVTSFIIARRRRKGRGFDVEAGPGAALPPP